jgi:hypothetical protein
MFISQITFYACIFWDTDSTQKLSAGQIPVVKMLALDNAYYLREVKQNENDYFFDKQCHVDY